MTDVLLCVLLVVVASGFTVGGLSLYCVYRKVQQLHESLHAAQQAMRQESMPQRSLGNQRTMWG